MYNKNQKKIHKKECGSDEHTKWSRKSFLQAMGLVGGGSILLANSNILASNPSKQTDILNKIENDRILVIVRLKGGNDGLNTVVPIYDYDTYANARTRIRISERDIIKLNDDFGIPDYAQPFKTLWDSGSMKVGLGTGYMDSSLSHFTGSDIWATTDDRNEEDTGWLGKYFEEIYPDYLFNPPESPAAIQIGGVGNLIFKGFETNYAFSVANSKVLSDIALTGEIFSSNIISSCLRGEKVRYVRGIANTTIRYGKRIFEAYERSSSNTYNGYSDNEISKQLQIISRLIKGKLNTKVYMVTLDGFDTHGDQAKRHSKLLTELSDAILNFNNDLNNFGRGSSVLTMTFSEFGRRLKDNSSYGTDHGTSSSMLFFGSALNDHGFIGKHPNLSKTDSNGNLESTMDFRQIYTTIMKEWFCLDDKLIMNSMLDIDYETVNLGLTCSFTDIKNRELDSSKNDVKHFITYENGNTILNLKNLTTGLIEVNLHNLLGQKLLMIHNMFIVEGSYKLNLSNSLKNKYSTGMYLYRIKTNKLILSNSFILKCN